MVGVIPSVNGTGMGKEVVEKVNDLADEQGVVCYLECGADTVGFYQKMGYSEESKVTVPDPVDPSKDPFECYIMVCKPNKIKILIVP